MFRIAVSQNTRSNVS